MPIGPAQPHIRYADNNMLPRMTWIQAIDRRRGLRDILSLPVHLAAKNGIVPLARANDASQREMGQGQVARAGDGG